VENSFEKLYSNYLSKVFTANAETHFLAVSGNSDTNTEAQEHPGPEVSLPNEFLSIFYGVNWFAEYEDIFGKNETEHWQV
jgi:hypothetical protein